MDIWCMNSRPAERLLSTRVDFNVRSSNGLEDTSSVFSSIGKGRVAMDCRDAEKIQRGVMSCKENREGVLRKESAIALRPGKYSCSYHTSCPGRTISLFLGFVIQLVYPPGSQSSHSGIVDCGIVLQSQLCTLETRQQGDSEVNRANVWLLYRKI